MITIEIGAEQRELAQANEEWINQQVNRRKKDGVNICVRVSIRQDGLDMVLQTPTCGGGGGGGRRPTEREHRVFDLWDDRGLNSADFAGDNVIAFLKQLDRIV